VREGGEDGEDTSLAYGPGGAPTRVMLDESVFFHVTGVLSLLSSSARIPERTQSRSRGGLRSKYTRTGPRIEQLAHM